MNKILQKIPKLKEIKFDDVEYETSKTNQTIEQTTCKNLVELKILSAENSNLLQAFQECQTMQKLSVWDSKVNLEEILQKYASLKKLTMWMRGNYPVSHQHKANATIHQLKVLTINLRTKKNNIHQHVISSFLQQKNLQQFYFNSFNNYNLSQSLCKLVATHIWQLKYLTTLQIYDENLLEEVEAFVANCQKPNTCLEEFSCRLVFFKSLPSSFFAHFTSFKKLIINCLRADETKVEDLISSMNKNQLTSIKLWNLPSASFSLLQNLQVISLQHFVIHISNKSRDEVPAFDILQDFLPKNPNITHFDIRFAKNYDEPKSLELVPMILATLTKLERLKVENCPKTTTNVIKQIAGLKKLKSWWINEYKSETFYKI